MRLALFSSACVLSCILASGCARPEAPAASDDASFRAFLPGFEEGNSRFINGDPTLWKQNASHRDDVSIMGGWGAHEKGWKEVGARYDWASSRFRESGAKVKIDLLSSGVSGDLAYTVAIERTEVLVVGQEKPAASSLRVTQIFRMEDGAWKLVHRHADPLINKTAPDAILQK